ncbi:MAG TPA: type II toxin-antitoxin system Phd/YefM family antitoxin [Longimicrobium sp.]|nr:type II toxin-antitoxin system Phd/YefM family antitoxin [Longimicrobium sp.]
MIDLNDIYSLSDFQRKTREHIERLKQTGKTTVLTVNGKAELVVQDASAYQALLDRVDEAEAIVGIQRGLDSMDRGEGESLDEAIAKIRASVPVRRSA